MLLKKGEKHHAIGRVVGIVQSVGISEARTRYMLMQAPYKGVMENIENAELTNSKKGRPEVWAINPDRNSLVVLPIPDTDYEAELLFYPPMEML